MLLRDAILSNKDLPVKSVEVPEWGGEVFVRTLTALELEEFTDAASKDGKQVRARFAATALSDEAGKRLFTDDDVEALSNKSHSALDRVWKVGAALNGIATEEKTDPLPPASDSTTALPSS